MRPPIAQGFYPSNKEILEKTILSLFSKAKTVQCSGAIGAVVPHAGYAYSGLTAAAVYASLPATYETIILLGTNHTGYGEDIAVSFDDWQTPLGEVKNDAGTGKKICELSKFAAHDEAAHRYEHSIEVQLPFLQMKMQNFKMQSKTANIGQERGFFQHTESPQNSSGSRFGIVPIAVSSGLEPEQYAGLAGAIKKAAEGKNALVLASSDFTHYGEMYGFAPVAKDPNMWVHETDRKIIDTVLAHDAKRFLELAEKSTVCGAGAIATLIYFAEKKGGILADYRTSTDVSGGQSAIVGYAGIIF